ncbi:MAG: leucine-rich repeat domain-containing protein [Bacilli bacterium]|nr:leucine-rich repeat domain-containing protein [Bacilli bacterium]
MTSPRLLVIENGTETIEFGKYKARESFEIDDASPLYDEISFPATLRHIKADAFYGQKNVKEIILNEGLETLDPKALDFCDGLTRLYLPSSLRSFDINRFMAHPNLESIDVGDLSPILYSDGGVLYNKDKTVLLCYPSARKIKRYRILSSCAEIAPAAFFGVSYLEELIFPSGIKKIGHNAFAYSRSLHCLKFPKGLQEIDDFAFKASAVNQVYLPRSLKKLGSELFREDIFDGVMKTPLEVHLGMSRSMFYSKFTMQYTYDFPEKTTYLENQDW